MQRMDQATFNEFVTKTILGTIATILGSVVSDTFTEYLEVRKGISLNDLPNHLDVVSASLKTYFGVGGETIERAIVRALYRKGGIQSDGVAGRSIVDVVDGLRQKLVVG